MDSRWMRLVRLNQRAAAFASAGVPVGAPTCARYPFNGLSQTLFERRARDKPELLLRA